jgi:hypothetical protein
MTTVEFGRIVEDWIATATHPQTGKRFTEMVYKPMLELLAYLHANGFKNFIVSGGGVAAESGTTGKAGGLSWCTRQVHLDGFNMLPYLPQCGALASSPHQRLPTRLPVDEQYAAVELFRGTMVRHSAVVHRRDRAGRPAVAFAGDAWRGYVPVRRRELVPHRTILSAASTARHKSSLHLAG